MSALQKFEIDGKTILVEVADISSQDTTSPDARFQNTSAMGDAAAALMQINFTETLQTILKPVFQALEAVKPDEANVELTLGFGVKGDLFIAKGEGNASLKISAKWKFESVN